MQSGSFGRVLQRARRAGPLAGTGYRAAPAAGAGRLDGALVQLLDRGEWYTAPASQRCATGQLIVCVPPPGARARDVTSLAGSPISRVPARTMASQGAATQGVSETPGACRSAAITAAAVPAGAWTGMCEATT